VKHDHLDATVRYAGPPYRLSETPWTLRRRPPLPGEHNADVFGELGLTPADIDKLHAAAAI
jgi:crotonobetainyl-CoA:carnitine CoA-transferase CaiB-like acyl-CoA transferase